jgi:hypothetical protein
VVPLNAHLTCFSQELEKELKCEEIVLPRSGPLELEDLGPGIFQPEDTVDELRK